MNRILKYIAVLCVLAALASVCVCAVSYDLYVGGVKVTDENAGDILGDADEGATVTYNAETNTLTLNNAHLAGFGSGSYRMNSGIYSENDLDVVLVGDNSISVFPNEESLGDFTIGFESYGDITISAEEEATLDIDVGTSHRENFGFYLTEGSLTLSGKVKLDITLSDILITDYFSDVNDTFGNSIGIHCVAGAYIYDEASFICRTGNIFVPENSGFVGTLDDINSGGTSVGIAVYGDLIVDTTGEISVYVGDSDGKRAGIASFSNFELRSGSIAVEMAPSKNEYLIAGAAVYITTNDKLPCIPLCGNGESDLITGTVHDASLAGMPIKYYSSSDGTTPAFTKLVTAVVGIPQVQTNASGNSAVTVSVENEEKAENALVVFAAYNVDGRMTDVKFAQGSSAVDGKISAGLDVSDAVRVVVFVFENAVNMKPIAHQLEITDLT